MATTFAPIGTTTRRNSPARLFAPLALIVCSGALFLIVVASLNTSDMASPLRHPASPLARKSTSSSSSSQSSTKSYARSTYTVKPGDNLSTISARTKVSIQSLTALNPALDPQAMISGECVNLRTPDDCKR